jgi:phosphoribosylformylglycinamidine synthase
VLSSTKGVITSYGLHPGYSEISPYDMAACSIDSAISAAVAAGADPDYLALLDNFCWCSPDDPKRLWQLKQAARACYDYAVGFGTPFISGKDSMHNDFKGFSIDGKPLKISIPPTLLISTVGVIPDVTKAISLDAKMSGDLIYILGGTNNELGGSEFEQMTNQNVGQARGLLPTPTVDAQKNLTLYRAIFKTGQNNLIASAIPVNQGGLAIALSKMLIAGGLGAEVSLAMLPGDWQENYQALFSQSRGRILITVNPKKALEFESMMDGNIFAKIGKITNKPNLIVKDKQGKQIIKLNLNQATKAYKETFKDW